MCRLCDHDLRRLRYKRPYPIVAGPPAGRSQFPLGVVGFRLPMTCPSPCLQDVQTTSCSTRFTFTLFWYAVLPQNRFRESSDTACRVHLPFVFLQDHPCLQPASFYGIWARLRLKVFSDLEHLLRQLRKPRTPFSRVRGADRK